MKKKLQMIIDIIMFILFLILTGYHITGNIVHEILGVITFVLFIVHHIINIKWYKALPKGKYTTRRIISTITDFLLPMYYDKCNYDIFYCIFIFKY